MHESTAGRERYEILEGGVAEVQTMAIASRACKRDFCLRINAVKFVRFSTSASTRARLSPREGPPVMASFADLGVGQH